MARELESVFTEKVPLTSTYLSPSDVELFPESSTHTFFLTIVSFHGVAEGMTSDQSRKSEMCSPLDGSLGNDAALPTKCPCCFGLLTLKEIPDNCLTSFDLNLDSAVIRGVFKSGARGVPSGLPGICLETMGLLS